MKFHHQRNVVNCSTSTLHICLLRTYLSRQSIQFVLNTPACSEVTVLSLVILKYLRMKNTKANEVTWFRVSSHVIQSVKSRDSGCQVTWALGVVHLTQTSPDPLSVCSSISTSDANEVCCILCENQIFLIWNGSNMIRNIFAQLHTFKELHNKPELFSRIRGSCDDSS